MAPVRVLVVQRRSHVADEISFSRSVFSRILEPFDYLVQQGKLVYDAVDENRIKNQDVGKYDALVFSKHTSEVAIRIFDDAKNSHVKTIYDLDDFLFFFPGYSGAGLDEDAKERFTYLIQNVDIVSIATKRLMHEVQPLLNRDVVYIPNGFNVERHYKCLCNDKAPFRLVFTNADQLKVDKFKKGFFDAVNSYLGNNPEVILDVFSDPNDEIKKFHRYNDLGSIPWFEHKAALASNCYKLGIVPLGADDDADALLFNSCKSPIKYLEYGGLKIAGVYSNSPIYSDIIQNRVNGILVNNDKQEWIDALDEVTRNVVLRNTIIENAFQDVHENHHVNKAAETWLEHLLS